MPDGSTFKTGRRYSVQETADLDDPDLRTYYLCRHAMLDQERSYWIGTWRDLSAFFTPRRGRFLGTTNDARRGSRKDQRIINNTTTLAARTLASGMQAGISSPARPWFRLRIADAEAAQNDSVRSWLDEVQKRILVVFDRSNLYNALHTLYGELGVYGTAALWVDEDDEDCVRAYCLTAGEYWAASSKREAVDTLYRSLWWTVRQIVQKFGRDAVSPGIRNQYDQGALDTQYEIIHAIEPNPKSLSPNQQVPAGQSFRPWQGRLARDMPWRSVWYENGQQSDRALLRVSGYEEFCCMVPRWEIGAGADTYGYGPGWVALGDGQQLQKQELRKLEVIDKLSKPPMVGPTELQGKPASLLPGGMTYLADPTGKAFRPAMEVKPEAVTAVSNDILGVQERIRQAFYADLFLMMSQSDRREITAREVDERHEEKMLMLGPVLERLHDELLDPLVQRVFNVMARQGLIPPPPRGFNLESMQVEFISLLAQAQKAVSTGSIERFWQFGGQIATIKPEVLDRLDADGTMDAYADMTGVPTTVLISIEKARKVRDARNAQVANKEKMQQVQEMATVGETASKIDVGGGANAVSAMLGGGGGQ